MKKNVFVLLFIVGFFTIGIYTLINNSVQVKASKEDFVNYKPRVIDDDKEKIKNNNRLKENNKKEKNKEKHTKFDRVNMLDEYLEYNDIQRQLDRSLEDNKLDFKDTVEQVVKGEELDVNGYFGNILENIKDSFLDKKEIIIRILVITIISAIFTNFAHTFGATYISEIGFMIIYMLLITILVSSFTAVYNIAIEVLLVLVGFMNVLMPVYSIASYISNGINTMTAYSQLTIMTIVIIETVFLKFLLPLVSAYMILGVVNNINSVSLIKRLQNFFKMIITWGLKFSIIVVTGLGTVRRIISPSSDEMTRKVVSSGFKMTPFIGKNVTVVGDTVASAASLIKDAIGGVSLIVIGLLCITPLVSIGVYVIVYEIVSVMVEAIADKRVINALEAVSESVKMLMYIVMTTSLLFVITIALMAR
ncbi:MAG: hypothetical protein E7262_11185 [Lachnospiraceae bacterium]|nr:hypothetical protein [Lachnospiraceae bacterium]